MVQWWVCECGKVVDEYEKSCYWCGKKTDDDFLSRPDYVSSGANSRPETDKEKKDV